MLCRALKKQETFPAPSSNAKSIKEGKLITVWDARKRYKTAHGENKEKFKHCRSQKEANRAIINFQNEINNELNSPQEEKQNSQQKTFLDLTEYFRREYLVEAKIADERIIEGYRQDIKKLSNQITDFGNSSEAFLCLN